MRMTRRLQDESETVPLAPLIDIVFLTLVFFMVTSVYGELESELDIALPTATEAQTIDRSQGEIFINLRSDGTIIVNDREMDIAELQEVLNRVAEFFPGGSVIVRGDKSAMLGRAIQVLDCCSKADIQNVSFAALTEEEPAS
jgi:biopolymer transport protein ExbD